MSEPEVALQVLRARLGDHVRDVWVHQGLVVVSRSRLISSVGMVVVFDLRA